MPLPLRTYPLLALSGPEQMARDEAMLLDAADLGLASLRFYTWPAPTVSLGYFQPHDVELLHATDLPRVRRATGGLALVHDRELTYALALPAGKPWQVPGESWLCRAHYAVRDSLAPLGVSLTSVLCGQQLAGDSPLCFTHHTPGDLTCMGRKVVGSAQRKLKGALLQHGGILLAASEHAPELPGIAELSGVPLDPTQLAARLEVAFAEAFDFQRVPTAWTAGDAARAEVIAAERYAADAWTRKR